MGIFNLRLPIIHFVLPPPIVLSQNGKKGDAEALIGYFKFGDELGIFDALDSLRMDIIPQHQGQVTPVLFAKLLHGRGHLLLISISGAVVAENQYSQFPIRGVRPTAFSGNQPGQDNSRGILEKIVFKNGYRGRTDRGSAQEGEYRQ